MTWYIGDKLYNSKTLNVFKHNLTLNRYNKTYYEFIKKENKNLYITENELKQQNPEYFL